MDECTPYYDHEINEFSLNRPIGDDWGQYIRHRPNPAPALVRNENGIIFVIFFARSDAINFEKWLESAATEQRHGFSTMRG